MGVGKGAGWVVGNISCGDRPKLCFRRLERRPALGQDDNSGSPLAKDCKRRFERHNRTWSQVIDFVHDRFDALQPDTKHTVSIGNLFLCLEGISDGVLDFQHELTEAAFQERFKLSDDEFQNLRTELQTALEILG